MHEVFISYSSKDKTWADAACAAMEGQKVRCWIAPRDITAGTEWGEAIIDGIDACKIVVLIFSNNANDSSQVRREVERAISFGKIVLVYRVENVRPSRAMEFALSNIHWLDAFSHPEARRTAFLAESVQTQLANHRKTAATATPAGTPVNVAVSPPTPPARRQFLLSFGRALVRKGLNVLKPFAEMVPFGGAMVDIAQDTWDDYSRSGAQPPAPAVAGNAGPVQQAPDPRRVEIDLRIELECLAHDTPAVIRQKVEQVAARVAGDQTPEVREALANYLAQVPAMLRRTMRRPSDPSGTTVPGNLTLRKGEDLVPLLPSRPPRFKSGDRPLPGVEWVLDEMLGVGGFGEVWKARHAQMTGMPPVALKFCVDEKAAKSLRNEAGVLNQVMQHGRHEGIVQLRQAYLQGATPCLEYEYIAGGDMAGLIQELHQKGRPSAKLALNIMSRLAAIIATVHRQHPPIVHRDLKPANILVQKTPRGTFQFKVADFGIGQVTASEAILTSTRGGDNRSGLLTAMVQGSYTPLYASPQQARGAPPDPRDDVYSLGVIWYQLLTGDLGSGAPSGMRWSKDLAQAGMPQSQIDLLASCFEANPAHRPANAAVLAEQLLRLLAVSAPAIGPLLPGKAEIMPAPTLAPGPLAATPETSQPRSSLPATQMGGNAPSAISKLLHFDLAKLPLVLTILLVGSSRWAIAAVCFGVLSILIIPAPLALITGLVAIRDIHRNPKLHGRGGAIFGIVMGSIGIIILIVLVSQPRSSYRPVAPAPVQQDPWWDKVKDK